MTKKFFEEIAKEFAWWNSEGREIGNLEAALMLASIFKEHNPQFSHRKFLEACQFSPEEIEEFCRH